MRPSRITSSRITSSRITFHVITHHAITHHVQHKQMTGMTRIAKTRLRGLLPWAALTLFLLPATLYLWYPGLQTTYDGLYHKGRFYELDLLLRSGTLYPRWLPHVNFGYGSPTLHFYAPLIYYIAEAFRLLGAGYLLSYELMIGLGLLAAGWTMFALARRWGMAAGWVAAIAYVYWPYHLELAYIRGAQAELWGMVWFPLLVLGVLELGGRRGKAWWPAGVGLALVYALLILTHHLSAFAFTPLLVAFVTWRALWTRDWALWPRALLSLALGAGLAALYWLPVLADISLVWAGRPAAEERAALLQVLVPLRDTLSPFWGHRYYPEQGVKAPSPLPRVSLALWAAALLVSVIRRRSMDRATRGDLTFFALVLPVTAFLFTVYSRAIWATVPLIHYLQFPWRLHALIGLAVAVVVGIAARQVVNTRARAWLAAGVLTGALALAALPGIHYDIAKEPFSQRPLQERDVDLRLIAAYDYLRGLFVRQFRDVWLFEYMPVWAARARENFFLPPPAPPPDAPPLPVRLTPGPQKPLDRTFQVQSPRPWTFSLHQFYFPAWQVYVDGQRVSAQPRGDLGLLSANIPAGSHTVRVRYGSTRAQQVATGISLLALLLWIGWALRTRPRWLVTLALVGVYFLVATGPARVQGHGVILPDPQDVRFGDRVQLVGSYIPQSRLRAGERVWFALYWFVLAPPQERYKVIVHLTDQQGNTIANGDTEPWFFFTPTTRWQQGELMEDWYMVDIPADVPAGTYLLLTGLYRADTVENLPVTGGTLVAGRVLVGEIEVVQR